MISARIWLLAAILPGCATTSAPAPPISRPPTSAPDSCGECRVWEVGGEAPLAPGCPERSMVVAVAAPDACFRSPESLRALWALEAALAAHEPTLRTASIASLVSKVNELLSDAKRIPEKRAETAQLLLLGQMSISPVAHDALTDPEYVDAYIVVLLPSGRARADQLVQVLRENRGELSITAVQVSNCPDGIEPVTQLLDEIDALHVDEEGNLLVAGERG